MIGGRLRRSGTLNSVPIRFVIRRAAFPILCDLGGELVTARSLATFAKRIAAATFPRDGTFPVLDASGEGWAFHAALMVLSPLTLKKSWRKVDLVRLLNESASARRAGLVYPEKRVANRTMLQLIREIAALLEGAQGGA